MDIKFKTKEQKLIRVDAKTVAENSRNFLYAVFDFDECWNGFSKKAVFEHRGTAYSQILTDDRCVIPYEVIYAGVFYVSLIGIDTDENIRITSSQVKVDVVQGPSADTENATPPTLTELEQLTAAVDELREENEEIRKSLDGYVPGGSSVADETDPTVPAWAKSESKPSYTAEEVGARPDTWMPTASEVGADAAGTAEDKVTSHNNRNTCHTDIRNKIKALEDGKLDASAVPVIPTNVSAFNNDAKYVKDTELQPALNSALLAAKASGEFDGADGYTPVKGVDYFTPDEIAEIKTELSQIETPAIVSSIDEMTDPTKQYVLDGYVYESRTVVVEGETTSPDLFEPTKEASADLLNKRLSGSSGSASASDGSFITDYISVPDNFSSVTPFPVRLNKEAILGSQSKVVLFRTAVDTGELKRNGANILTTTNTTVANGETVTDIRIKGDSSSALPSDWSEVTHVRIQYQLATTALEWGDIEDCKVTFDVYNETTEGSTRIEFVNTGELYTPTGNDAAIMKNSADITELKTDVEAIKEKESNNSSQSGAVWYAIGDSITRGYGVSADECWVSHVRKYNGYDPAKSKNLGVDGIGFVRIHSEKTAKSIVDGNDFSTVDLVTVAIGINDWQNNCSIEDVKAVMAYCFEKILSDNPYCKIFFITPLNKNRGTKETNWALGYEQNGITLKDFVTEQISVCKDYGIEVIDMTHNSVINKVNLPNVFLEGDNTHPNSACHLALGRELARKITFA